MRFSRQLILQILAALCALLTAPGTALASACYDPLGEYFGMEMPAVCADPIGCAIACHREQDPLACRWIIAALRGSRIGTLPESEMNKLDRQICEGDPGLCPVLPPELDDAEDDSTMPASCDELHLRACNEMLEDAECDENRSCTAVQPAFDVFMGACIAGDGWSCISALKASDLLMDGGAAHRSITAHFSEACDQEDLPACRALELIHRHRSDDDSPVELQLRIDKAARTVDARRETLCRSGSWLTCVEWLRGMERAHHETEDDFCARRETAAAALRTTVRPIMAEYLRLRCNEGDRYACRGSAEVAIAGAQVDGLEGALESLIAEFERRCVRAGEEAPCLIAGGVLLKRYGDAGLDRARPLLTSSCGTGGCEALATYLRSTEEPGKLGWRTREAEELSRRGCAAGAKRLCGTTENTPESGLESQYIIYSNPFGCGAGF